LNDIQGSKYFFISIKGVLATQPQTKVKFALKFENDEILCFYELRYAPYVLAYRTLIIAVNVIFGIINEYICIFGDFCNRW